MGKLAEDALLGMANRFMVTIDPSSRSLGSFAKAQGLEVSIEVPEYRSGEDWNYLWSFPGKTKYQTIKLERAAVKGDSEEVQKWYAETATAFKTHIVTIELQDAKGEKILAWVCQGAFPAKWSITTFEAGTSKIAVETLEISHVGFLEDAKK
jgi:phage tail-like protein